MSWAAKQIALSLTTKDPERQGHKTKWIVEDRLSVSVRFSRNKN